MNMNNGKPISIQDLSNRIGILPIHLNIAAVNLGFSEKPTARRIFSAEQAVLVVSESRRMLGLQKQVQDKRTVREGAKPKGSDKEQDLLRSLLAEIKLLRNHSALSEEFRPVLQAIVANLTALEKRIESLTKTVDERIPEEFQTELNQKLSRIEHDTAQLSLREAVRVKELQIFTIDETAEILKVGTKTVRRLIATGAIPKQRVGGSVRVRESDLRAYLESERFSQYAMEQMLLSISRPRPTPPFKRSWH